MRSETVHRYWRHMKRLISNRLGGLIMADEADSQTVRQIVSTPPSGNGKGTPKGVCLNFAKAEQRPGNMLRIVEKRGMQASTASLNPFTKPFRVGGASAAMKTGTIKAFYLDHMGKIHKIDEVDSQTVRRIISAPCSESMKTAPGKDPSRTRRRVRSTRFSGPHGRRAKMAAYNGWAFYRLP